jgi:hypothetical protein
VANRPVDEKIVAMKMDNSDFVKKASETTKLMSGLTKFLNMIPGINLGKTTDELKNINKSINGVDTSRLSSALDTVTSRFSTLGIVGTTALVNITNRAVDAGLAMVRNLTVAPILDGFREYELKIGSIQTILANTAKDGTSLEDVTGALQELNLYADKTIYNFGQMTKNIGLFTNAGLGLKESVSDIRGFANAAAASGAGAEEMARAAYQLSQGLASGFIITQDWMSLTNAGMGNDNMKRDLIALGQAMGTLGKSTTETLTNWKESLTDDKWLTKEVFSTYLQAMAGDLDKATLMTKGLTEAQADLLIQNAKTGEEAATKVRTFTQMMATLVEGVGSGWSETWEIIIGDFENATQLWSGFSDLVSEPFNRLTESRNNFLKTLKDKGVFEDVFVGLGTAVYVVGQAITAMTGGFDAAFSSDRVGLVTSLVQGFRNFVTAITPSQESLVKMATIFQAIGSNVRVVMKIIGDLGGLFAKLIPSNLGSNLLGMLESLAKINISFNNSILNGQGFKTSLEGLGGVFSWIGDRLGDLTGGLSKFGKSMLEVWTILSTGQATADGMFDKDSKVVVWLAAIGSATKSVISSITSLNLSLAPVRETFNSFFSAISSGFSWLRDKLSGIGESIKAAMPSGTTLFAGGFIAALVAISGIVLKRVNDITKMFGSWRGVVKSFAETLESVSGALDAFALNVKANALLTASIAVGALAASVFLMSRVDGSKIATSLSAIVGSLAAVIGAMSVMNKFDITGGLKTTASIIGMAVALSIMSISVKKFGDLKPDELTRGLIGITTIMAALAGSFALMGKFNDKDIAIAATQIVAMSISVMIIAKAVREMGTLKVEELAKGIGGLAAIILAISSAFVLMGKFGGKGATTTALQFVGIAASILLLVGAIKTISSIDPSDLLIGLGTITAILAAVAGFSVLTSEKDLLGSAVGLLAISVAINALVIPLFALGSFPIDKLIIGLVGMSVALLAIAGAAKLMNGAIVGAASIVAMAFALNLLIVPLAAFAAMGWGGMLLGVAGLTLSLAALAGVSLLLTPATVPLLLFSAAIGVMGVAMLAAGAGMALFSTGLVALAGMTAAAITTIIATLGALITGIASLIPSAVKFVIQIIKEVATAIRDNAPEILSIIADTILRVLTLISTYIPQFAKAAVKIITSFLDAVAEEGPKIIDSYTNLIVTLIETLAKTVDEKGPRFVNAFLGVVGSILKIMVEAGTAVVKALFGWIPGVEGAMSKVAITAESAIAGALDTAKIGQEKGTEFAKGISDKKDDAKKSGEEISKSADEGFTIVNSKTSGEGFVSRFISGLLGRRKDVEDASRQLAGAADEATKDRLGVHSPGDEGIEAGEGHGDGLALGQENSIDKVKKASEKMADGAVSGLSGITGMIRDKLFIKDKDVDDNDKKAKSVSDSYSNVADSAKKSAKSQTDSSKKVRDALSEEFRAFKDKLEERKYYNQLSLEDELENWEYAQKVYVEGTEERKQADREVYRVKNEIEKASFKTFKDGLDERAYYNELSLEDELENWQYAQNVYLEGTEERKQADREVYRVQKEIDKKKEEDAKKSLNDSKDWIDERKSYNELSLKDELAAWERVQKRYLEGSDERKQADKEIYRVKNEINQKLLSLNDEYLRDVKETNKALIEEEKRLNQEYESAYKDRVRSLTGFVGLFDKVKSKDPENPVTGTGLISNLKDQVNAFATWGDDIKRLAQKGIDEGLLKELEDMGPSAAIEIAALNELTSSQLDQYVELWRKKNELARTQATKELEPLREDTNRNIDNLRKDTEKKLDEYKSEWLKKISEIRDGTTDNFVGLNDDMNVIGERAIKGLMDGMSDMESPLYSKVRDIAKSIEKTIKETLGIDSATGKMSSAGQNLLDGVMKAPSMVVDKSKALASKAIDSINDFISTYQEPNFDNEIQFKAVLDDSEINGRIRDLNNINNPYFLETTNGLVSSAKAGFRQNGNNADKTDPPKISTSDGTKEDSNRPVIIQSILNGRIVAEETFDDVSQLMSGRTNLDYAMRGV